MKLLTYVGIMICLLVQYSCTKSSQNFKVGFLVHTLQDQRWAIERDVFESEITKLGGQFLFDNAELDERKQFHQAKKMIEEGIDVLVIAPVNSKTAASIARICHENGVKIIAYDIIIENCDLDLYVSFNNEKVGELMAQYAMNKYPNGKYVIFWGDGNMKIAHWIKTGQMNVLNKSISDNRVSIVYQAFIDNWSPAISCYMMERILSFTPESIDVVIASSDGIAQGIIDAYSKFPELSIPLITGQDACETALLNIKNGTQSMSVYKSFKDLAGMAALKASQLANNKDVLSDVAIDNGRMNVPSILLDPTIVDSNTLNIN